MTFDYFHLLYIVCDPQTLAFLTSASSEKPAKVKPTVNLQSFPFVFHVVCRPPHLLRPRDFSSSCIDELPFHPHAVTQCMETKHLCTHIICCALGRGARPSDGPPSCLRLAWFRTQKRFARSFVELDSHLVYAFQIPFHQ